MRFRPIVILAALLTGASAGAASAQGNAPFGLRGPFGGSEPPPKLAPPPAAVEDEAPFGPVLRQQPVGKGPDAEVLDDTATGSIRRTIEPEEDPFAALGIRKGSFILFPSLTATTEYSTNASGTAGGGAAPKVTLTPELAIRSDWALHEATLTLRGSYARTLDGSQPDEPSASAEATGRIDLKPGWNVELGGRYGYEQQAISDPDFPAGVDTPPGVHEFSGRAALNGRLGRKVFAIEGNFARTSYENGTSGGLVVDQGDRTNSVLGARLRLGYESPLGVTPFVEGDVSRRLYDRALDGNGLRRSSLATIGRAGLRFDREPVLSGELAVGYGEQRFDDAGLATLRALTVDGSLVWSPTRLVTVTIDAATAFSPSADPASSGSVTHDLSIDLAHAVKRNFTVNWTADLSHQNFQGTGQVDTSLKAGIAATWKINRKLHLTGGYVHEWMASNVPGSSFQSDAIRLELRLQR